MSFIVFFILSAILGFILLVLGELWGSILAFGIFGGCLFQGLYLLYDIHRRICSITEDQTPEKVAFRKYLEEKERD